MVNISFSQERIQRAYGSEEPPETLDTRMGAGNHPCMYTVDMVLRAGQAHSVTLPQTPMGNVILGGSCWSLFSSDSHNLARPPHL